MNEEWQDIVDENDKVIGKDTRENIWAKGLESKVRVVNLFVLDENKNILMPVRSSKKKKWPLCYDFACGENVVSGESYEQAIIRGIKEELGSESLDPVEISYLKPKDGVSCYMKNYKAAVLRNEFLPKADPEEIDHFEWKTIQEVKELLSISTDNFKNDYKNVFDRSFN